MRETAAPGDSPFSVGGGPPSSVGTATPPTGKLAKERPRYFDCTDPVTPKQIGRVAAKLATRTKFTSLSDELDVETEEMEDWINRDGINTDQLRARAIMAGFKEKYGLTVGKLTEALHNIGMAAVAEGVFGTEATS